MAPVKASLKKSRSLASLTPRFMSFYPTKKPRKPCNFFSLVWEASLNEPMQKRRFVLTRLVFSTFNQTNPFVLLRKKYKFLKVDVLHFLLIINQTHQTKKQVIRVTRAISCHSQDLQNNILMIFKSLAHFSSLKFVVEVVPARPEGLTNGKERRPSVRSLPESEDEQSTEKGKIALNAFDYTNLKRAKTKNE